MPCRDYDYEYSTSAMSNTAREAEHKEQRDLLARIACKALTELESNGIAEALLLRDDEVAQWWARHKEADRKAAEKLRRGQEREAKKQAALAKLSKEERKLLGIEE